MRINYLVCGGILIGIMFLGAVVAKAALTLGNGYYTNLCDSGTKATYYSCNKGCNVVTGTCTSNNTGVVKYVCTGKWNQCLESESQWSNFEQVSNVGCGLTVQLSLFDKKCRKDDGSWDSSCKLSGYLVWYSGDCRPGFVQATPIPTPTNVPTIQPTATPTPTASPGQAVIISQQSNQLAVLGGASPTVVPTVTPQPTIQAGVNICGIKCSLGVDCGAGFACVDGVCRNPACTADSSCFCKGSSTTLNPVVPDKKTPETGAETWLGMIGMMALGGAGFKLIKMAKKVW